MRRVSDLGVISSFKSPGVSCICELSDGSFVTGSDDGLLKRWREENIEVVLQTFSRCLGVRHVVEVNPDTIASWNLEVQLWRISTGERIRALDSEGTTAIAALGRSMLASASKCYVDLWGEKGDHIERIGKWLGVYQLTRLRDGSVVISSRRRVEIRKWSVSIFFSI